MGLHGVTQQWMVDFMENPVFWGGYSHGFETSKCEKNIPTGGLNYVKLVHHVQA